MLDDQVAASMPPYHASSAVQLYLLADAKKSKKRQKKQSNFDEEMIYLRDFLGCHAADLRKGTVSLIEGERAVLTAAPDFATSRMYDPGPFGSLAHDGSSTVSASVGNDGIGIVSNMSVWIAHMWICYQITTPKWKLPLFLFDVFHTRRYYGLACPIIIMLCLYYPC